MKLLQKYLKDNAELEYHSENSNSTYWKMYGKKWRVSSHVNVNPAMNQIPRYYGKPMSKEEYIDRLLKLKKQQNGDIRE